MVKLFICEERDKLSFGEGVVGTPSDGVQLFVCAGFSIWNGFVQPNKPDGG